MKEAEIKYCFEKLFHQSPYSTCIFDPENGNLLMANALMSKLLDEDLIELQQKNIYFYVKDTQDLTFRDYIDQIVNDKKRKDSYQTIVIRGKQDSRHVIINASVIELDHKLLIQSAFVDITSTIKYEEKEQQNRNSRELLSKAILELNKLESKEKVLSYTSSVLSDFFPKAIISVSQYLTEENKFVLHDIRGLDFGILSELQKDDIFKIKVRPIDHEPIPGRLFIDLESIQKHHNIYADVSKTNFYLAQELLRFQKIYTARLSTGDNIQGAILLLTSEKDFLKQSEFVEIFVAQVVLVLEKMHNEKALIKAKERAEESDQLKSAFLSNMSHEIRTPMNALLGFSDLLMKSEKGQEKEKYSLLIQRAGGVLMKIIDDIIDISKIENNQLKIVEEKFSVTDLLEDVNYFYTQKIKTESPDVHFAMNNRDKEDIKVKSDEYRLRQILINLLNNAIKFTKKGIVSLDIYKKGKFVFFHVKDTGVGIPKDKERVIFDRFRRGDDTQDNLYSGTGLGLSISKHLANLLGGDLLINSEYKEGAEFILTIATNCIEEASAKINIIKPIGKVNIEWKSKLLYIAEDELSNYQLLEAYLESTNIKIQHFENGKDLLKAVKKKKPDLILLDIKMPIMNGYEAVKLLKSKYSSVKVIAQTAYAMAEEKQKAINAGCDDFITKPIKKNILLYKMGKYLNKDSKKS